VADTAHCSLLSKPNAEDGAGVNREKKAPGGVESGDRPRPFGWVGVVAEVGELAESGASTEVAHRRSFGVARCERLLGNS
jgi:hypothetical protein